MKSNDKTLVILTPAFPENESATYWIPFLQLMTKALKKNFPDLNIIVLSFFHPAKETAYTWHGIKVISFDGMRKRKLKRIILWRNIWKKLNHINQEQNIVGLFSIWCGECAFIGKWFGKKNSIKHLTWICGQDALKRNKWVSFIRPKEDQLAAMSPFLVNEFYKNHGIKPQFIIPNAIDPGSFPTASATERGINILGAGSLVPLKQYDLFVNVVDALQNSFPAIKAFHCGDGSDKEKINALIKKFELADHLNLLGNKQHEDVLRLMLRTKIFLHTSSYEGFGGVCLEALYAGAHVISFIYPLDNTVAHWHVVKDTKEMIAKAIEILGDPGTDYTSVLVHSMDDSARSVMKLFDMSSISGNNLISQMEAKQAQ